MGLQTPWEESTPKARLFRAIAKDTVEVCFLSAQPIKVQVLIELTDLRKKIVQSFRSITLISSATLHEGPTDKEEVAAGSERERDLYFDGDLQVSNSVFQNLIAEGGAGGQGTKGGYGAIIRINQKLEKVEAGVVSLPGFQAPHAQSSRGEGGKGGNPGKTYNPRLQLQEPRKYRPLQRISWISR